MSTTNILRTRLVNTAIRENQYNANLGKWKTEPSVVVDPWISDPSAVSLWKRILFDGFDPSETPELIQVYVGIDPETIIDDNEYTDSSVIVKDGPGTLILSKPNYHRGGLIVEQGEVVIQNIRATNGGQITIKAGAKLTLDIGDGVLPAISLVNDGLLDIDKGGICIGSLDGGEDYARQQILASRSDGYWYEISGITSTEARKSALEPDYTDVARSVSIGYLVYENGAILIRCLYYGDVNFDGLVNMIDLNLFRTSYYIAANLQTSEFHVSWQNGDFDYDMMVDFDDVLWLFLGWGQSQINPNTKFFANNYTYFSKPVDKSVIFEKNTKGSVFYNYGGNRAPNKKTLAHY